MDSSGAGQELLEVSGGGFRPVVGPSRLLMGMLVMFGRTDISWVLGLPCQLYSPVIALQMTAIAGRCAKILQQRNVWSFLKL